MCYYDWDKKLSFRLDSTALDELIFTLTHNKNYVCIGNSHKRLELCDTDKLTIKDLHTNATIYYQFTNQEITGLLILLTKAKSSIYGW